MENEDLEELEIKYKELGEKIENLKNKKKCKRLRAENHSIYYFINDYGNISFKTENHINIDDFRYKTRNYFKTREEAQEHLDNINTYYDLMNLAEELNNGRKINWNRSIFIKTKQ